MLGGSKRSTVYYIGYCYLFLQSNSMGSAASSATHIKSTDGTILCIEYMKVSDLLLKTEWLPLINETLNEMNPLFPTLDLYLQERQYNDPEVVVLLRDDQYLAHCLYESPITLGMYEWYQDEFIDAAMPYQLISARLINVATALFERRRGYGTQLMHAVMLRIKQKNPYITHVICDTDKAASLFYKNKCSFNVLQEFNDNVLLSKSIQ